MNKKRLKAIRGELEALRGQKHQVRSAPLERIAKRLGRTPSKRGKEPNFVSDKPGWTPLSIPNRKGRTLSAGTATSIINALEEDVTRLEEELEKEKGNGKAHT